MRRHAIRRNQTESTPTVTTTQNGTSRNTSSSAKFGRDQCCLTNRQRLKTGAGRLSVDNTGNRLPTLMDVDDSRSPTVIQGQSSSNSVDGGAVIQSPPNDEMLCDDLDDEEEADTGSVTGDIDAFDDDSFGLDDDTGVSLASLPSASSFSSMQNKATAEEGQNYPNHQQQQMEVDDEQTGQKDLTDDNISKDNIEVGCLLRHVQFGRALVNLVKQIRTKTGGLSFETEQLLQQSVSLLAYPSPASMECPLRSLLDPIWRETVASFINSAVLKAQNLPTQPALEDGLRSLHKCFLDACFVEAQTLGHFLLYHLTPNQLDYAERLIALAKQADASHAITVSKVGDSNSSLSDTSANAAGYQPVVKRQRICTPDTDQTDRRDSVANGHLPDSGQTGQSQPSIRRQAPRRRRVITVRVTTTRAGIPIAAETSYPTTSSSSSSSSTSSTSMEEVIHLERSAIHPGVDLEDEDKEDDDDDEEEEEEEEDDEDVEEEESCHVDDDDDHPDDEDGDGGGVGRGGGSDSRGVLRGNRGYQRTSATTRSQTRQQSSNRGAGAAGDHLLPSGRTESSRICPFGLQFLTNVRPILMQSPESVQQRPRSQHLVGRVGQSVLNSRSRPYVLTAIPPLAPLSSSTSARNPLLVRQRYSLLQPLGTIATAQLPASQTVGSTGETLNTAYTDLLSLAHPQHVEFLAAMDDALKAYTGSALILADDASSSSIHRVQRHPRNDDPPAGAGTGSRLV